MLSEKDKEFIKEYKLSKKYKISDFINYSFYIETITIIYKPINSVQNGVLLF